MEKDLVLTMENGVAYADSRQVAEMIGKDHAHLCRDIAGYATVLTESKIGLSEFFVKTSYRDASGKSNTRYDITKQGCEMVANKLTGKKGILFTAAYVDKFNQMEREQSSQRKPVTMLDALAQTVASLQEQERQIARIEMAQQDHEKKFEVVNSRLDTINGVCIDGDKQQKLNAMVRLYASKSGATFAEAWRRFKQSYNTAFHTNISLAKNNYAERKGLKRLTCPEYLTQAGLIDDGLRIADKMLSEGRVH